MYSKDTNVIDVNTKSVQIVKYSATDSDGNSAVDKIREYIIGYKNEPIEENNMKILADDFTIKLEETETLTLLSAKDLAYVEAWTVNSGQNSATQLPTLIDSNQLVAIQNTTTSGQYPLTFSATDGVNTVAKTVTVKVYDENAYLTITADDITGSG